METRKINRKKGRKEKGEMEAMKERRKKGRKKE